MSGNFDSGDGRFRLVVDGRAITADQILVATGPFQTPYVPKLGEKLSGDLVQAHAVGYRRPGEVPDGTVLVVGGGNTGFQIAKELTLIGSSPREMTKDYSVELRPRLVNAGARSMRFEDGSELKVDAVIWATGYRPDYAWINLPILGDNGRLRHRRGVTDVPGLYFLGLTSQHTRGSALIGFIENDAEFIAERIAEYQRSKRPRRRGTPVAAGAATEARSSERS